MMFKVKIGVDVIRNGHSKREEFETMMDQDTFRKCTSDNGKKEVETAWCNTMFPGADKIRIMRCFKI